MKAGTKFNAIYKSSGNPVMVQKFDRELAEFTATKLVKEDGIEWQEAIIKGRPLESKGCKERPHQLFTRFLYFEPVI